MAPLWTLLAAHLSLLPYRLWWVRVCTAISSACTARRVSGGERRGERHDRPGAAAAGRPQRDRAAHSPPSPPRHSRPALYRDLTVEGLDHLMGHGGGGGGARQGWHDRRTQPRARSALPHSAIAPRLTGDAGLAAVGVLHPRRQPLHLGRRARVGVVVVADDDEHGRVADGRGVEAGRGQARRAVCSGREGTGGGVSGGRGSAQLLAPPPRCPAAHPTPAHPPPRVCASWRTPPLPITRHAPHQPCARGRGCTNRPIERVWLAHGSAWSGGGALPSVPRAPPSRATLPLMQCGG